MNWDLLHIKSCNQTNNNNNVPFLYSAYHIQMASLCARGIITPALVPMQPFSAKSIRRNKFMLGTHLLHLGRERQVVDKMPCLRANALSGIRTHNLLIASREHKPLHSSAPSQIITRKSLNAWYWVADTQLAFWVFWLMLHHNFLCNKVLMLHFL